MTAHMTARISCDSARALSDGKPCGKLRPIGSLGKHANGTLGAIPLPPSLNAKSKSAVMNVLQKAYVMETVNRQVNTSIRFERNSADGQRLRLAREYVDYTAIRTTNNPWDACSLLDNIKARTLYRHATNVYHTARRLNSACEALHFSFKSTTTTYLRALSVAGEIRSTFLEKLQLGIDELGLFYEHVEENPTFELIQMYAICLLSFYTSARPGSLLVGKGNAKGARLSVIDPTKRREVTRTLRFEHLRFFILPDSHTIGVELLLRYLKGLQNQAWTTRDAKKKFTILPITSSERNRHLDCSTFLFALACARNASTYSATEILNFRPQPTKKYLQYAPAVAEQALFVSVRDRPLTTQQATIILQHLCISVGLIGRFTLYSFRREGLITLRRRFGLEFAHDVAGHARFGATMDYYDEDQHFDFLFVNAQSCGPTVPWPQLRASLSAFANRLYHPQAGEATLKEALLAEAAWLWERQAGITSVRDSRDALFRQAYAVLCKIIRDYLCESIMDTAEAAAGFYLELRRVVEIMQSLLHAGSGEAMCGEDDEDEDDIGDAEHRTRGSDRMGVEGMQKAEEQSVPPKEPAL